MIAPARPAPATIVTIEYDVAIPAGTTDVGAMVDAGRFTQEALDFMREYELGSAAQALQVALAAVTFALARRKGA